MHWHVTKTHEEHSSIYRPFMRPKLIFASRSLLIWPQAPVPKIGLWIFSATCDDCRDKIARESNLRKKCYINEICLTDESLWILGQDSTEVPSEN